MMKIGDLVMFVDEGVYARWFFGQLGVVEEYTLDGFDDRSHCRVRWLQPVRYGRSHTTISDFSADKFEVCESAGER